MSSSHVDYSENISKNMEQTQWREVPLDTL